MSSPGPPRLGLQVPHTRDPSPPSHGSHSTSPHLSHMPSFSLIGALEFRRVVSSLQEQAAGSRLSMFESPRTPYPGGHYHSRYYSLPSRARAPLLSEYERGPREAAAGLPLERRTSQVLIDQDHAEESDASTAIPAISHTPASPSLAASETETEIEQIAPPSRRKRILGFLSSVYRILFPTLHDFRSKSFLGKIAAVFAAPAVMALTLTLPVVVTDYESVGSTLEKPENTGRLVDFEEEGVARALM